MEPMNHCYSGSVHSSLPVDKELSSMVIILTGVMYLQVFLKDVNDLPSVMKIFTDVVILHRKVATHKNCVHYKKI